MKNHLILFSALLLSSISFGQTTTWYQIPTGTTNKLRAIDFPTETVGYIVGDDSTILKTLDGGATWVQMPLNGIQLISPNESFYDVDFIDADTGFLTAAYSGIYKTSDGGQSWNQMVGQISNMCYHYTVFPFASDNLFSGGAGCFEGAIIDHFEDVSWITTAIDTQFWDSDIRVQEFSFVNPTLGLAATKSEIMLRTIDSGATWDTISTGITGFLTSVIMVNDTLCYAGYDENGGGFGILVSTDGGLTWEQDINSATFYYPAYLSVHAAQNGDIYSSAVPSNALGGLIFENEDGTNWMYYNVDQTINDMTSYGSDITFGVGDNGYLVVNVPLGELGIYGVDLIQFSAYPNPVLKELTIDNPNSERMEVIISDAGGRMLMNEIAQPGQTAIDCASLNSGMYFVQVKIGERSGLQRIVKQ